MKRIVLTSLSCLLSLGLFACDKKSEGGEQAANTPAADATKDEAKAEAKKADEAAAPDEGKKAGKKEEGERKDETVGLTGVLKEAGPKEVADKLPAEAAEAAEAGAEAAAPAGAEEAVEAGEAAAASDDEAKVEGAGGTLAAQAAPAEAPADAPHYDTSKDKGGLIGHLATGLVHDAHLTAEETKAELAKLSGEDDLGPSNEDICNHVIDTVLMGEMGDMEGFELEPEMRTEILDDCVVELEKERIKLGPDLFRQQAECVLAAQDFEALMLCDQAEEEAEEELHEKPHGEGASREACTAAVDHLFTIMTKEFDDPDMAKMMEEDFAEMREEAISSCMDEATAEELACVMKAESLEDLESCD